MEYQDYYKLLGVPRDAEADMIKKAFRKAARKYHPDINKGPDAEAEFKAVNEAYEVLKDPESRAAYDELGKEPPPRAGHYEPPPNWDREFSFSGGTPQNEEAFSDFFETLFRRGASPTGPSADSHSRIEVSLEDAYRGADKTLSLRTPVVGPNGDVTIEDRTISVRVPKGIRQGQHIRLAGQGASGGDLFLEVSFAAHPVYHVDGSDLHMELPITPWEAALGGHVVLPTPSGKVDLRIPKNARSGQKLRLKGKGLPGARVGDIFATLRIVNPKVSTEAARALFEKMAQEMPFDPRTHLKG